MNVIINKVLIKMSEESRVIDAIIKYYSEKNMEIPETFPEVRNKYGFKCKLYSRLSDGCKLYFDTTNYIKINDTIRMIVFNISIYGILINLI